MVLEVDGRLCSSDGETAGPYRGLAPQTWSVQDVVWTALRTLRLAIAIWVKGASWRAQGWAGENGDRHDRALHPSQIAGGGPFTFLKEEKQRAWKDYSRCSPSPPGKRARSRVNDCKAIGGSAGGNDCAQGWAGANGDRSELPAPLASRSL